MEISVRPPLPPTPSIDPMFQGVLIGGGKPYGNGLNWPGTGNLLDAGLELTGAAAPRVVVVASARWRKETGVDAITRRFVDYYNGRGADATVLHPFLYAPHNNPEPTFQDVPIDPGRMPGYQELQDRILGADNIFVLGGDTYRMLEQVWKPHGIDTLITQAIRDGTVVSGTSAGSLAWFAAGQSDSSSKKAENPSRKQQFYLVQGLGMIASTIAAAHYDARSDGHSRKRSFAQLFANYERSGHQGELAVGIDDNTAMQVTRGGVVEVIRGGGSAAPRNVHAMHYRQGRKQTRVLTPADGQFTLASLAA